MNKIPVILKTEIARAFSEHATCNAVHVDDTAYTYTEIAKLSSAIANVVNHLPNVQSDYIAVFGYRSIHAYTGIYGILLAGYAYMPLNPLFPTARLGKMLESAGCNVIILSDECAEAFSQLAENTSNLTVICPNPTDRIMRLRDSVRGHTFIFPEEFPQNASSGRDTSPEDPVYLLFTSGSTGVPKGVSVTNRNLCSYLSYTIGHYDVSKDDRLSQMFDITFDLSAHDIFVSLLSGACLYVVPKVSVMAPAKYIKEQELTLWFSVPSVAMFMEKIRLLKPGCFLTLRYSLFCGEAMPQRSAEAWQTAAPNSIVENLYGPTEATIAITNYRWNSETSPSKCVNGIVPIGNPFDGHRVAVVGENGEHPGVGGQGELFLAGPQVTNGYLNDPEQTAERFVQFKNSNTRWYRTGDLVKEDDTGCIYYLGRTDEQIQIRGYRAELQEIDRVLREAAGTDLAVSVPKLVAPGQAEAVYAFVQGEECDFSVQAITRHCQQHLPEYMVPFKINFIREIPLNVNGKINRKALIE